MSIAMASMPLSRFSMALANEMLLRAFGFGDHVGRLVTHQRERFVEQAVRMDVDGFDPLAFDPHRQAPATSLRVHRVQHPATAEHNTRRALEKVSSCGHVDVSPRKISFDFLLWFLAYVPNANTPPTRRMRSACCALAAIGHAAAPLTSSVMNSRRLSRSNCICRP